MTDHLNDDSAGELLAAKLRAQARQLAHLNLTVNGEDISSLPADQALRSQDELGLRLGKHGRLVNDGGRFSYPLVLSVPDRESESVSSDALREVIVRTSTDRLFDRLSQGWTEQDGDGNLRHCLSVVASDDSEYESFVRTLASRRATSGTKEIGRLAFDKSVTIAPTTGLLLIAGEAGKLTEICMSELLGIGVVLDEMSDTRDRLARAVHDVRLHDERTNRVRDRFNRRTTPTEMARILATNGWESLDADSPFAKFFRGEVEGELVRESRAFIIGDLASQESRSYRAFDVLVQNPPRPDLVSPDQLAQWLVDEGHVAIDPEVLVSRGPRREVSEDQDFGELLRVLASAVSEARLSADAPLAFAKQTPSGAFDACVSVMPSGSIRRWNSRDAVTLLLAAAQMTSAVRVDKAGNAHSSFRHNVPPAVVTGVMAALEVPGVLAPVRYFATEPMLTPDGRIVRLPGYDRSARVYLSIPHRDRARWAAEYDVPEHPTREQAQAAFEFLKLELLSDFAYEDSTARARHMAYLLTCVGRSLINGSIGFLATAPDRGSGKSLCLLCGRVLAQGNPSSVSFKVGAYADEEAQKQLAALLRDNGIFFHCDEIPRGHKITGLTLTSLLTAVDGEASYRLLGGQDSVVQSGVICTMAGSNVEPGGDFNRRLLTIRLGHKGGGSPITRTGFRHANLVEFIGRERPRLLAAAHTILLHGLQNPHRVDVPSLGFSHNWADRILGAMSHLDDEDGRPLSTVALEGWLDEVNDSDELGEEWGELLWFLWWKSAGRPTGVSDLRRLFHSTFPGEVQPPLPGDLFVPGTESDDAKSRHWAKAIKKVLGASIPGPDGTYRIAAEDRGNKSKKSLRYIIEAFDKEGAPRIPGRAFEGAPASAAPPVDPDVNHPDLVTPEVEEEQWS